MDVGCALAHALARCAQAQGIAHLMHTSLITTPWPYQTFMVMKDYEQAIAARMWCIQMFGDHTPDQLPRWDISMAWGGVEPTRLVARFRNSQDHVMWQLTWS